MITNFQLDLKNARSVGSYNYINKSGAYVGVITLARLYETDKNHATMLVLEFQTQNKEQASIQMCLYDKDGKETFQKAILDSLMTVLQIRQMNAVQGRYKAKDGSDQFGFLLKDLMNKPVGLLLQYCPEEYSDKQGNIKVANRLNIVTPFNPLTRQNAKEFLDKVDATTVDARLKTLKDKELKKLQPQSPQSQDFDNTSNPPPASTGFGMDEDIPF